MSIMLIAAVIGKQRGRFKSTFNAAQHQLRTKFGMEMVELPVREKVTLKERRGTVTILTSYTDLTIVAAQKTKTGGATSSAAYILTSILPEKFRSSEIMPPSKVGNPAEEAAYTGFYTFVVCIIALSPSGALSNHMLSRYLERVYAEKVMPLDKTENILLRMIKQGYIVKTTERTEQDENIEYRVGPRGKIEIGNRGIQGMVLEVYGDSGPDDLERRVRKSLGIETAEDAAEYEDDEAEAQGVQRIAPQPQASNEAGPSRRSGRR